MNTNNHGEAGLRGVSSDEQNNVEGGLGGLLGAFIKVLETKSPQEQAQESLSPAQRAALR